MAEGYFSTVEGSFIYSTQYQNAMDYSVLYSTRQEALADGITGEYKYRRDDEELFTRESRVYVPEADSYGYITTLVRIHTDESTDTTELKTIGFITSIPASNAISDITTGLGMKLRQEEFYLSELAIEESLKDYEEDGNYPVVITADRIFCYLDEMIEKVRNYFTEQEYNTPVQCPYDYSQKTYPEGQSTLVNWDNKKFSEVSTALGFENQDNYMAYPYDKIFEQLKNFSETDEDVKEILQCSNIRTYVKGTNNYIHYSICGWDIDNNTIVTSDHSDYQNYGLTVKRMKWVRFVSSTSSVYQNPPIWPTFTVYQRGTWTGSVGITINNKTSNYGWLNAAGIPFQQSGPGGLEDTFYYWDSMGFTGEVKPYEVLPNATPVDRTKPDVSDNYPEWNPIINILRPITVNTIIQDWRGVPDVTITYIMPPIINRTIVIVIDDKGPITDIKLPHNKDYGLFTIYLPVEGEDMLSEVTGRLWNPTILERIQNIFKNNPMDAVISLHEVYLSADILNELRSGNTPKKVYFGNVEMTDGNYEWTKERYCTFSMGALNLNRIYNDYRDFERQIEIYLPFIGFNSLSAYDLVGKTTTIIEPIYVCDILTGDCICNVYVRKDNAINDMGTADYKLMYTYTGNISSALPLSSNDKSRLFNGTIGAIGNIATALVTKGGSLASSLIGAGTSVATAGTSSIQRSGQISGNNGAMNFKRAFLLINNPKPLDVTFNDLAGYTTNLKARLSSVTGFTRIKECHVDTIPNASDSEKAMIESLLKQGIIL